MKKAIGYIRVSTDRQAQEGVSLEAQRAKIESWCKANDYDLMEVFIDAGLSGKSMEKRPALLKSLATIKRDMALVVYSLSRLARSTKDTLTISDHLVKAGADLVSLSEKLDTTGAAGKMMFRLLAVVAEFERDVTAERTTSALAYKKARGDKYGTVPFGYSEKAGKLTPVESESLIVAEMVTKRDAGKSFGEIATWLNNAGIRGKKGGQWHPSTVRYLIQRQP
jgi:site-specific DNA recombinase